MSINREVMAGSQIFEMRGENVKWPTLRGAYLTDESVEELKKVAITVGKSIVFLDGMYKTNLNKWVKKDPIERAIFFEWNIRHGTQMFFALCWIGNFHNGSIFHIGYQFPHITWWKEYTSQEWLERQAFRVYERVAKLLYSFSSKAVDLEVSKFLKNGNGGK